MLTIYTFGYRNPNGRGTRSHEEFRAAASSAAAWPPAIVDVRRMNSGHRVAEEWRSSVLSWLWLEGYWPYPSLGNFGKTARWERHNDASRTLIEVASAIERSSRVPVLLCAEAHPRDCHRTEVASDLANILRAARIECEIRHLGVPGKVSEYDVI